MQSDIKALLDAMSLRIMRKYPSTGIYRTVLQNCFVSRFNYERPVVRQYSNPLQAILMLRGGLTEGALASCSLNLQPGQMAIVNTYTSLQLNIHELSPQQPVVFLNVPILRHLISEVIARMDLPAPDQVQIKPISMQISVLAKDEILTANNLLYHLGRAGSGDDYGLELALKSFYFALLCGSNGDFLRSILAARGHDQAVLNVLRYLSEHYTEDIDVNKLASDACMSKTTFYKYFRDITNQSPLTFIKTLRLYEGRRLILTERYSASRAAYAVGYESSQHFSRDYRRLFHCSPMEDKFGKHL